MVLLEIRIINPFVKAIVARVVFMIHFRVKVVKNSMKETLNLKT